MNSWGWPEIGQIVLYAAILGLIPATIGYLKGKRFLIWWIYGTLVFIVALPASILMKKDITALERRQLRSGHMKRCAYCAELIRAEARVCKHCGREFFVD